MSGDLLSSLDVVNKAFKKTMRGYDPGEVDEFLDRVVESIRAYVQKTKDYENMLEAQAEKLADYDNLKGSLHEALLMAQRTAEEKVSNAIKLADHRMSAATAKADDIVAEARVKAEQMIREAESEVVVLADELKKMQQLRTSSFEHIHAFIGALNGTIENAENAGHLEIPDFILAVTKKSEETREAELSPPVADHPAMPEPMIAEEPSAEKKMEISDTLNALGIDPNLLNPDI